MNQLQDYDKSKYLLFISENHDKYSGREIARKLKISQTTVLKYMYELGIRKKHPRGKVIKYYPLDLFNVHEKENWLTG